MTKSEKTGLVALGNQLFDPSLIPEGHVHSVFMREDRELCTYYRFHKHKLVFFLGAMRAYARELDQAGFAVTYQKLNTHEAQPYEAHLLDWVRKQRLSHLLVWEIEDKFFEQRLLTALKNAGVAHTILPSPMFLTPRQEFQAYLGRTKKPFMKTFYEAQRKRLRILVDKEGQPEGGRWSFDEMNRKPLPKTLMPPALPQPKPSPELSDVIQLIEKEFPDHPGTADGFWLPVDRAGAQEWLERFIRERLADFGPYEDALAPRSDFVFHSVLTPFLNTGLLTPDEVVRAVLRAGRARKLNLASIEGFVRQVIGWREFIRGVYQGFSAVQDSTNFWDHRRRLNSRWYDGTTGVDPLDHMIRKVSRLGYAHHIERLMVAGNLMLLMEVHPHECHRWFMEMFIDSSDWVMGPNVYGMGIFSDGGIFATKPYICGSNYYRKMGGYKAGDWCDGVDGLYWSFIDKHRKFFSKNPRLSMMVKTFDKMDPKRKRSIFAAAGELKRFATSD